MIPPRIWFTPPAGNTSAMCGLRGGNWSDLASSCTWTRRKSGARPQSGKRVSSAQRRTEGRLEMINVDPVELQKFSELAHRWWDPQSEFKPLHQINPLRLDWIQSQFPLAGKRVLDVGCGGGILSDSMARKGAQVVGIDL